MFSLLSEHELFMLERKLMSALQKASLTYRSPSLREVPALASGQDMNVELGELLFDVSMVL